MLFIAVSRVAVDVAVLALADTVIAAVAVLLLLLLLMLVGVVMLVQVFEALTKRTRPGDTVATKLTRVKDSALARRIWVDKVWTNLFK